MTGEGQPMGMLHLVLSADHRAWADCCACAAEGDRIVLLDAGVMLLTQADDDFSPGPSVGLAVSSADASARGLKPGALAGKAEFMSDEDIIALIARHPHCLSWR